MEDEEGLPPPPQSLTLVARAESLAPATEFMRQGAREANLPELHLRQLELLTEEILTNVYRYAYAVNAPGRVTFSYLIQGPGEMNVEVQDEGVAFNPLEAPDPDLTADLAQRQIGGLGILLLKSFAKSLSYRREDGCNQLSFVISANADA